MREGKCVRWVVWLIFVIGWTAALEFPVPPTIRPTEKRFVNYLIAKSVHVAGYALFTLLSAWVPLSTRHRTLMMYFLMAHAALTEMWQELLEPYCHRGGVLTDVGIDQFGIAIGIVVSWKWWTRPDVDDKTKTDIVPPAATEP
jgi:VanZ family protein